MPAPDHQSNPADLPTQSQFGHVAGVRPEVDRFSSGSLNHGNLTKLETVPRESAKSKTLVLLTNLMGSMLSASLMDRRPLAPVVSCWAKGIAGVAF